MQVRLPIPSSLHNHPFQKLWGACTYFDPIYFTLLFAFSPDPLSKSDAF